MRIAGALIPGQRISDQTEDSFTAAQNAIGQLNVPGGQLAISNIPVGAVAYSSLGTSTTNIIQLWVTDIWLEVNRVVSNIQFLQGSGSNTDNWVGVIYDSYGHIVASTAVAGIAQSGANTFQTQAIGLAYSYNPVTAAYTSAAATSVTLYGPQQYFVGIQINNTTANAIRLIAASTYTGVCCGSVAAGTFGTIPSTISPVTTFTATKGPIVLLS